MALWGHDAAAVARIAAERENVAFLPGRSLGSRMTVTADLTVAVGGRDIVLLAVPSEVVRQTVARAVPTLTSGTILVCASKGLEPVTGALMSEVIEQTAPGVSMALLSGPTFAAEIARGLPAAAVVASRDAAAASSVQHTLGGDRFRIYTSDDTTGVAIAGALKNVIAIAAGCSDGLGFGHNTRAALITRGLSEIGRLAVRQGAHPLTIAGLAGLGDLVLTCTGDLSRNRKVGLGLAAGGSLAEIVAALGQVAEGIGTASTARDLAGKLGVQMPIVSVVAAMLSGQLTPRAGLAELMAREAKPERG